ncbi:MAG: 23S rRNA (pseudouridine(1915)-N(3))-methyltransferase RlmH [Lachnospiraceae bacterium]|nr:23S rRNA (pseudouridine(1915)-N(3))-methyltransferase RlmH [Lachnospiraceae bacterium]
MKVTIICVGKIKEKYWIDAIKEYSKRLNRYCKLNIVEVADEATPDNASAEEENQIKQKEGARIISKIPSDAYNFTLEINGKSYSSVAFSKEIEKITVRGVNHLCFIIGGSLGLHESVIEKSNSHLSFSEMTFPHQMMRVILLEQIYRAFRISRNEPYHK